MICNNCGGEFEAARKDARFCSPKCRVTAGRRITKPASAPVPQPEVTKADVKAAADAARRLQKVLDDAGTGRKRPAVKPGLSPCCKHCTHAASVSGHMDPCRLGCA